MTGCSAPATTNSANPVGEGMSGTTPPPPPVGGEGGADPSMEDILASIRRILNEDEAPAGAPESPEEAPASEAAASPRPEAHESDGVLVLDEAMLAHDPVAAPEPAFAALPVEAPSPEYEPRSSLEVPASATPPASAGLHGDSLMAPESAAAATASLGSLLRTLSKERATQVYRGGPTIEDLVREEIRPLLKDWLDLHLPPLVERLVRQEIERVAGRAAP